MANSIPRRQKVYGVSSVDWHFEFIHRSFYKPASTNKFLVAICGVEMLTLLANSFPMWWDRIHALVIETFRLWPNTCTCSNLCSTTVWSLLVSLKRRVPESITPIIVPLPMLLVKWFSGECLWIPMKSQLLVVWSLWTRFGITWTTPGNSAIYYGDSHELVVK